MTGSDVAAGAPFGKPLILTAEMEPRAFAHFEALRRRHFPPERNRVPAHITLFHHLPGPQLADIESRVRRESTGRTPPPVRVAGVQSLGRGVAYRLHSDELEEVRAALADAWQGLLMPQDQAPFRPHVTVQNKVEPHEAKALACELEAHFRPFAFALLGLRLCRYLGGPWLPLKLHRFARR